MPPNKSRFVLLCQQSLAIAVVVAVAAPAANVVTLDIVAPERPGTPGPALPGPGDSSVARGADDSPSLVASRPVKPRVTDVPLTGVSPTGVGALSAGRSAVRGGNDPAARLVAADGDPETDDLAVLSDPEPVANLATVGVTWEHGEELAEDAITVSVRTEQDGAWSEWQAMPYHDEHGPDPTSAEGRGTRPGTDPVYVGDVDDVQVKAVTESGDAPEGMRLSLVDPGKQNAPAVEKPAIDTGTLGLAAADTTSTDTTTDPTTDPTSTDEASLSAGAVTSKPKIYSRAQWGADERMRDKSSLRYGEVHAGFVHHTVNANSYTAAQVPSIIRGIYAYHTQSRGWSDVGYNFLVDRFGRIWEGRYGGVDRPVIGAHTLGYNDDAFAMSAIGNFETARPPAAMLDAYGRLFAWKLSLHGVRAGSTRQWVTKRYLPAINGHRDVGQTACPGKYLYAKIPTIRSLAVGYQKSFASRNRTANIAGSSGPDLVVRSAATKIAYLVRTSPGGELAYAAGTSVGSGWSGLDLVTPAADVTGDGVGDLVGRAASTKRTRVYAGDGKGHFVAASTTTLQFSKADQLIGVGDWNGDGRNDLMTRSGATKKLYLSLGDGHGRFGSARLVSATWGAYRTTMGTGDFTGDKRPDLAVVTSTGKLSIVSGTRTGLGASKVISSGWGPLDLTSGLLDVTGDRKPDLVGRNRNTGLAYVFPGNGAGNYGAWLGPFSQMRDVNLLMGVGQVAGSSAPDLVGRDSAGRLLVFTRTGEKAVEAVSSTGRAMRSANLVLNAGDWNRDGHGDVITRSGSTGGLYLYRGNGAGALAAPVKAASGFGSVRLLAAVGDITGDGFPDLMGQPTGGSMRIYPGNGSTGFRTSYVAHSPITATQQAAGGLWNSDGSPDSLVRRDGKLVLYPGNGPGGLTTGTTVGSVGSGYDWLVGLGDVDRNGRPDLVAREKSTGTLWLLPGTSAGGIGARRLLASGMGAFDLAG